MSNLQKVLDGLQPYVIGIRYLDKVPVIDVVFKDGWIVPESNIVSKQKGNNEINYYMIYTEKDGIGLDELLEYVESTININVERENKHELLKLKVDELKDIFKKNSLSKLTNLKFSFSGEESLTGELGELDLTQEPIESPQEVKQITPQPINPNISEEELEMIEEEKRAENFKKIQEQRKTNNEKKQIHNKIELPPRNNSNITGITESNCNCGPNEACEKCIEFKDL